MIKENQLQGLKRLESFIKENIPRYKTNWHQGKLYVKTIFLDLGVMCRETAKGVVYFIFDANYVEWNIYSKNKRVKDWSIIIDVDKEDQLRKVFKDLYDEEVRLEDKYIKKMEVKNE